MAVHGFVTHAAANRRKLWWLVASYIAAFQIICAFALIVLLAIHDPGNTIITNPLGYAIRYVVPVGLLTYALFWLFYRGHLKHVQKKLDVKIIVPGAAIDAEEKRLLRVAEPVCVTAGLRQPQFGLINVAEPNALAVGAARNRGLIAVTRGLLQQLDDDELATVIAHEAAHIRNGDTQIMAANHALMRTATNMQVNNPLRLESWQPLLLAIALPFFLPLLLAGNAATMLAMRLSFQSRRGIGDSRDFIADAEAVRVTHFPDALISALHKVDNGGAFWDSENFRLMLFAGGKPVEGEKLPGVSERIENIKALSGDMLDPARVRRDTRSGHMGLAPAPAAAKYDFALKKRQRTPPPPMPRLSEILSRPSCWTEWHEDCVDFYQWREDDQRNAMGLKSKMFLPLAVTLTFLVIFHWPTHGTFVGALQIFNPANLVAGWETPEGGLAFFKYASKEAAAKQSFLTLLIMAFFIFATAIPGLREKVYPHVDWTKKGNWRGDGAAPTRRWDWAVPEVANVTATPQPRPEPRPESRQRATATNFGSAVASSPVALAAIPRPTAPRIVPERFQGDKEMTDQRDEEEKESWQSRVVDEAKNMAIDEVKTMAINEVVEKLSGGWLSYEGNDDDEERPARNQPAKRQSFEQRLARELAMLPVDAERAVDESTLPPSISHAFDESIKRELERLAAEQQQAPVPTTVQPLRPAQAAQAPIGFRPAASPMGFGRKIA